MERLICILPSTPAHTVSGAMFLPISPQPLTEWMGCLLMPGSIDPTGTAGIQAFDAPCIRAQARWTWTRCA
ncbi:hypothetical protein EJ03DRAFT_138625 [Teratosphaeria nubilosa]|uniref:Uncharacterized protein n=1 Tax=Teratosphaeria nubilosa TaxID=161662 RepID=A0A6G1L4M2_9PEZI|nr:hypothetical protein EJ03DRAFT_138625 [Teratosphaeria nubilosa]